MFFRVGATKVGAGVQVCGVGKEKTRTFKQQNFQDVSANIYVYEYQRIMSVAVWLTNHLWVSQFQEIDWQAVQYSFNLSSAQSTKDLLKLISTPD